MREGRKRRWGRIGVKRGHGGGKRVNLIRARGKELEDERKEEGPGQTAL